MPIKKILLLAFAMLAVIASLLLLTSMSKGRLPWPTDVPIDMELGGELPIMTLEWAKDYRESSGLYQTCCGALNAFDVDKDGEIEILIPFRKDSDRLLCIAGRDGTVEWVYPAMSKEPNSGDLMGSPCIGDMDGDGEYEVLYMGRERNIYCLNAATGRKKWIRRTAGNDASITLCDLDGDGRKEAIAQAGQYLEVVDHRGQLVWKFEMGRKTQYCPNAFDIDQDGETEVIGADDENIHVMDSNGLEKWRFPSGGKLVHQQPVIADFDDDGEYEVAFHSEDRHLHVVGFYGQELWNFPVGEAYWPFNEDAGKHEGGIAAADLDADGFLEIITSDIIGNVYCINHDGTQLWHRKLPNEIWSGMLIGDFTGDGRYDVIVEAEGNETHPFYPDGCVMILDGATGQEKMAWPRALTASTPSAGDMDGDGMVEIVAQEWSQPILLLTSNASYDPDLWPWAHKYRSEDNRGAVEMDED